MAVYEVYFFNYDDDKGTVYVEAEVENAVNALLEKEGLQAIRDSFGQTLTDIKERRANRLEQEDILGLR